MSFISNSVSFSNMNFNFSSNFNFSGMQGISSQALTGMQGIASAFEGSFGSFSGMSVSNFRARIPYAVTPDFQNAGNLSVNKKNSTVKTPGGYEILAKDGKVKIKSPNGKWSEIEAVQPERTLIKKGTKTETRNQVVARRDPIVRESDGDKWRFQGDGSFRLPDGTKISIKEKGEGKDLHINQVDIYNGNKHVQVKNQLKSAKYETYNKDVKREVTQGWQQTNRAWQGNRLVQTDSRQILETTTEKQRVKQTFNSSISDVKRDGYLHDALTKDGKTFSVAGDGDDWSVNGREVVSGAGKGKDDPMKMYQLGGNINRHRGGEQGVNIPLKTSYLDINQTLIQGFGGAFAGASSWGLDGAMNSFSSFQSASHLGSYSQMSTSSGVFSSPYAGPMGGFAMASLSTSTSHSTQGFFGSMLNRVADMGSVLNHRDNLAQGLRLQRAVGMFV
jgi:hypothetical protein